MTCWQITVGTACRDLSFNYSLCLGSCPKSWPWDKEFHSLLYLRRLIQLYVYVYSPFYHKSLNTVDTLSSDVKQCHSNTALASTKFFTTPKWEKTPSFSFSCYVSHILLNARIHTLSSLRLLLFQRKANLPPLVCTDTLLESL